MRILKAEVTDFGSYRHLTFDFTSTGLALIYGPTGAGKSTLQDIVPWIAFGITAKGVAVDEVCNWMSIEPTEGSVSIETQDNVISIYRERSQKNDLYFTYEDGQPIRGKDLADTQRLINQALGVDADTFTTACCLNEFSDTGNFFLLKATQRREVFEKIANLSLPTVLTPKLTAKRSAATKQLRIADGEFCRVNGSIQQLTGNIVANKRYAEAWTKKHAADLKELKVKHDNFEVERSSKACEAETKAYRFEQEKTKKIDALIAKIEALPADTCEPCPTCGVAGANADKKALLTEQLEAAYNAENPHLARIDEIAALVNTYDEQYKAKEKEVNPHLENGIRLAEELLLTQALLDKTTAERQKLQAEASALSHLQDLTGELRGALLKKAVRQIQDATNGCLDKYFDSEFKVSFSLDGDSLEVEIRKNGYLCVYRQLSKGQRQLLRLCLSVSVMKAAANKAGISFNALFFDEAIDGLDTGLKAKAYSLFEHLSVDYPTVLVTDHNQDFQAMFTKKYKVTMINDESSIEHES